MRLIATPDNKKEPAIPGSKMYGNLSYTNARVALTNLWPSRESARADIRFSAGTLPRPLQDLSGITFRASGAGRKPGFRCRATARLDEKKSGGPKPPGRRIPTASFDQALRVPVVVVFLVEESTAVVVIQAGHPLDVNSLALDMVTHGHGHEIITRANR